MKLIPYWALGQLSLANLKTMMVMFPPAILATWAGVHLTRRIPEALFFRLVLTALAVVSVKLTWDGATGLYGG